jgi:hypothetical protein
MKETLAHLLDELLSNFHKTADIYKLSDYQRRVLLDTAGIDPDVYEDWLDKWQS